MGVPFYKEGGAEQRNNRWMGIGSVPRHDEVPIDCIRVISTKDC